MIDHPGLELSLRSAATIAELAALTDRVAALESGR